MLSCNGLFILLIVTSFLTLAGRHRDDAPVSKCLVSYLTVDDSWLFIIDLDDYLRARRLSKETNTL